MPVSEIIDPTSNPAKNRKRILQFVGPVLGVILVIGGIVAISLHNYQTMRGGVISLSRDLLRSQQRYVTEEVEHYLAPASDSASIAPDMFDIPVDASSPDTFMLYGRSMLAHLPQVDSFYLANDKGEFWMVIRHKGAYDQTHLQVENGQSVYRHTYVDQAGNWLGAGADPGDKGTFRQRPWFAGAMAKADHQLYWTDPYAYLATHQFIITASIPFTTSDGHRNVFAINISLNRLTEFLNSLQVGKSGQAVIVDLQGHVIAGHNVAALSQKDGFDPSHLLLDPVTQPVFTRALNVYRVNGSGAGLVHARNKNYVTIASALPMVHRDWVLLLNAPENDFSDFAQSARRRNLGFSLVVVALALLLAVGVIFQGRRVEQVRGLLERARHRVKSENSALLSLARTPDLFSAEHDVPALTEILAQQTLARRVSVWRFLSGGERLISEDTFEAEHDVHGAGFTLSRAEHDEFFSMLLEGHEFTVDDAGREEKTRNFQRLFMRPFGTASLHAYPITANGHIVGCMMLEDARLAQGAEHIIAVVGAITGLRFVQAAEEEAQQGVSLPFHDNHKAQTRFDEGFLLSPEGQMSSVPSGIYPAVPVAVISFAETFAADRKAVERSIALVSEIGGVIQRIAQDAGLFSVQVVSNRIVLIGGCRQEVDAVAAIRLADAAILIREACYVRLAQADMDPVFRIGLDMGPLAVAQLGNGPSVLNFWGRAIVAAERLALTAPDAGTIQVSEDAYTVLREQFLFRSRGMFFVPGRGAVQSFTLAGRRE
nr:cache domain-containing protein [uncultured Neokomagataea sp.]